MTRKLVQAGSSLAVTLPAEVVKQFKLKKGAEVEVSVHPQTGAVTIRPGVLYFEGGKVTPRFAKLAEALLERRSRAYQRTREVTVYLALEQVLELHRLEIRRFGGSAGLRDRGGLEAAPWRGRR